VEQLVEHQRLDGLRLPVFVLGFDLGFEFEVFECELDEQVVLCFFFLHEISLEQLLSEWHMTRNVELCCTT